MNRESPFALEKYEHDLILGGSTGTNKEGKDGKPRVSDETLVELPNGASAVFDGISTVKDSIQDAEFASKLFEEIFEGEILDSVKATELIKEFINKIKEFGINKNGFDNSRKARVGCTITFSLPITVEGKKAMLLYSNGDSPIFGINKKDKIEQLTLNSHRLFRGFEDLESASDLSILAKKIQQYTTDALIKIETHTPQPPDESAVIHKHVQKKLKSEYPENYEILITKFLLHAKKNIDLVVKNINPGVLEANLKLLIEQSSEITSNLELTIDERDSRLKKLQKQYSSKQSDLKFAQLYQDCYDEYDLQSFLKIYSNTINRLDRFENKLIINPEQYLALVTTTDGVSESVQSKIIGKVLKIGINKNIDPSTIAEYLIKLAKNGPKKDDSTAVITIFKIQYP